MRTIQFEIDGVAIPKQTVNINRRSNHLYIPRDVQTWEETCGWKAKAAMIDKDIFMGPVWELVEFFLPDGRIKDLENLMKSLNDGIKKIVFEDDSQVAAQFVFKSISKEPHVTVLVSDYPCISAKIIRNVLEHEERTYAEKSIPPGR